MKLALCAAFLPAVLSAQVILETGILTGATTTAAGAAGKGTAKALSGVFGSVEKTATQAAAVPQVSKQTQPAVGAVAVEKPAVPVKLPEVAQISTGMTREELLAKFGAPSQKMTIPEGSHLTERYRYDVGTDSVRVILEDGKVKEAIATAPPAPPDVNGTKKAN